VTLSNAGRTPTSSKTNRIRQVSDFAGSRVFDASIVHDKCWIGHWGIDWRPIPGDRVLVGNVGYEVVMVNFDPSQRYVQINVEKLSPE
jgi:hypothetical protein